MNIQGLRKMLQYSIIGINEQLRTMQENILLRERFGDSAVDYPEFFNPLTNYSDDRSERQKRSYDDLLEFAKEIQSILDEVKEAELAEWVNDISDFFQDRK
jgi:hypothetical protein